MFIVSDDSNDDDPPVDDPNPSTDSDNDGIEDVYDDCPFTPGLPELNGCPDESTNSDEGCDEMDFDCDTGGSNDENSDCPVGQSKNKDGECVGDCDTFIGDLKKVFPDTTNSKLQEIADVINKYNQDFGIDSKLKLQHFLAQAGHESGRFKVFEENLNYRISKLGVVYWGKYFNPISDPNEDPDKANPNDFRRSQTSDFVDKEKFANLVYGNRMGNGPDEGYKYRGRGIIQLTGKNNYSAFNTFYKENYDNSVDLIANPNLLSTDSKIAVSSALWFFKKVMDKVPIDKDTTVRKITKIVNGGTNGLSDRESIKNSTETYIDCL